MNLSSVRIALKGIAANRMRSALTTLGIMIGVASVIMLVAVGSGSAAANRKQLESLGSNTLTVRAGGFGFGARGATQSKRIAITDDDVRALLDTTNAPDITQVVPGVNVSGAVTYDGASTTPDTVEGTTSNFAAVRNYAIDAGSFLTTNDVEAHAKVAVVGPSVAKNLLGAAADPKAMLGKQVKIGPVHFTVVGVLKSKGSNGFQDQDNIVVLPITTARDTLTGSSGTVDALTVQAKSGATNQAQAEITAVLTAQHKDATASDFQVLNQASLLSAVAANNATFTVLLGAVAAISLLVGGIGVMNIMLVTVTERTREIGIRKAVGARRSHILTQFLVEAVLLGGIGGLMGVAAGLGGSHFELVHVQPVVEPYSVLLAFSFAVATGLFFGIYPANRAAMLRPIDALRYE
ncbi:MAG: putative transport system permease protein [Actinomycetota bacterium]|jgi:putative ABC transport system permease protein|nr:putative transport system permease protein [Actinomycetota bacterium]